MFKSHDRFVITQWNYEEINISINDEKIFNELDIYLVKFYSICIAGSGHKCFRFYFQNYETRPILFVRQVLEKT